MMEPRKDGGYSRGGDYHWKEYGISRLLPPASEGKRIVLIGCGDGGERPHLASLGFEMVGLDISPSPGTDLVADAHQLPLKDESFDVALSMQVLEHLHSPWIAMDEAARVLRPGGWFLGSVAFLKGYHNSFFHMSHLGVTQLLNASGLEVDHLSGAQSITYTMLGGMVPVGPASLRRKVLGAFDGLLFGTRKALWTASRRKSPSEPLDRWRAPVPMSFQDFDRLRWAPAVVFRARKPS
jgi:SAM-dependent methyltransferase